MHTVVMLAHALNLAERLGYSVRQEWIDGNGGGACEVRGRKYLFIDLAAAPAEQFEKVLATLRGEPSVMQHTMPQELRALLKCRKIA